MSENIHQVAERVLREVLEQDPHDSAPYKTRDVARLAMASCSSCPFCGAERWVNIDCAVCRIGQELEK